MDGVSRASRGTARAPASSADGGPEASSGAWGGGADNAVHGGARAVQVGLSSTHGAVAERASHCRPHGQTAGGAGDARAEPDADDADAHADLDGSAGADADASKGEEGCCVAVGTDVVSVGVPSQKGEQKGIAALAMADFPGAEDDYIALD